MRRQQSRDSCDSVAFARPRARRALTGLQRSAVPYTTWTKRRQRAGQPRGMGRWAAVFRGRKVAIFRVWLCSAENRPLYIQI